MTRLSELSIGEIPGQVLHVQLPARIKVYVSVERMGPSEQDTLVVTLLSGGNIITTQSQTVSMDSSGVYVMHMWTAILDIPSTAPVGVYYDITAKLVGHPELGTASAPSAIVTSAPAPAFRSFSIVRYDAV